VKIRKDVFKQLDKFYGDDGNMPVQDLSLKAQTYLTFICSDGVITDNLLKSTLTKAGIADLECLMTLH
jgi:hypothetical protein